jgi:hypothetical protein
MPPSTECASAFRHGILEMLVPCVDKTRRQPPLDEVTGAGQLPEKAGNGDWHPFIPHT